MISEIFLKKKIIGIFLIFIFSVFFFFNTLISPVFAISVDVGDVVSLQTNRSIGVPLHEFPRPSLMDRIKTGETAKVLEVDESDNWIKIELKDGRIGWVVERYIHTDESEDSNQEEPGDLIVAEKGEIFPDLNGDALLSALDRRFSPDDTLGYGAARNLLYSNIDNKDGVLSTIYSGLKIPLAQDSADPKGLAFSRGVNAEHVWPQSKGAKGQAKSDMHHLFPSRIEVNSDRSSDPFGEISDSQTESWYIEDEEFFSIPDSSEIDFYSEAKANLFEPREAKKGDVARAMFYFKTVYPERDTKRFFKGQRVTLCQWNQLDPVDLSERNRSHAIAQAQGNENPFVLDESLASRTYCR